MINTSSHLTHEEIENLEIAINAAIKQTTLLMMIAVSTPNNLPGFTVRDILSSTVVLDKALQTIDKLKGVN